MPPSSRPRSSRPRPRSAPLHVWKFGGASLADATAVATAASRIAALPRTAGGRRLGAGRRHRPAARRRRSRRGRPGQGRRRRRSPPCASATSASPRRCCRAAPARRAALAAVDASVGEFEELLAAVAILQHLSPRTRDLIVARGERLSATLLAAAVTRAGRRAVYVDATEVVVTDDQHGGASPLIAPDDPPGGTACCGRTWPAGRVPVVPGFIGRAADGSVATLGRGGSDLTATLLARALGAEVVSLWKDVPGILTSDPRLVPDARLIPQLHHQEAAEVAHYGAKVLHPRALIPISGTRITLEVRSFLDPSRPGTTVAGRLVSPQYPVKAVAVLPAPGRGHRGRQGHGRRARHRRADLRRGGRRAAVGVDDLPGVVGELDRLHRAGGRSRPRRRQPAPRLRRRDRHRRDRQRRRAGRAVGDRRGRRRHGRHAGHRRAGLHGARDQRRQRRRHRPGIVRAQHLVRRHRRGRRRGRAQGARRLSAVEDRRRPAAGPPAHRRGAARLRPRRPGPGRADRRDAQGPPGAHRRAARSLRLRLRRPRHVAGAPAPSRPGRRTPAACWPRSAARPATAAEALAFMAEPRRVAAGAGRRDQRRDQRHAAVGARPRLRRRARQQAAARRIVGVLQHGCSAPPPTPAAPSASRPPSAPGCR